MSDATGHTRWLDHVVCPRSLKSSISHFRILYTEIGSDHKPLGFTFTDKQMKFESTTEGIDRVVTYKVGNKEMYRASTETALKSIALPICALLCKNKCCKDKVHLQGIESYANQITSALIESSNTKILRKIKKSKYIPGWNDFVEDYHNTAREKFLLWRELGSPRNGFAYEQMVNSRREFKKSLNVCKRMKDVIIKNKIATEMKSGNPWNTINKVREKKSKMPVSVNGITGEKDIAEHWRDHYAHTMSGEGHPSILAMDIKNVDGEECPKVIVDNVRIAMQRLSFSSAPGLDNVTGDHLKHSHPTLLVHLSLLFTLLFSHSFLPNSLTNIKIVNLIKDHQKSFSDLGNYRPIALASLISKLFECVILQRCETFLRTTDNQFAYKEGHSTDQALFLLKQTVEFYRSKNSPVFLCAMDLSKAFDRVCHKRLFEILEKRGVPSYIISLLINWYKTQKFRVTWGNSLSSPFHTKCGIRQGSVLSALLFAVYMDDLSRDVLDNGVGCTIGDKKLNHILYADDIILLSPSVKSLQNLIDKCLNYFNHHHLTINSNKTKVMVVKPKRMINYGDPILVVNGSPLEVVNSIKYLGMQIDNSLRDDEHIKTLYRGQCMRANVLIRNFHMCSNDAKTHLFKSFCTSMYGIPVALDCKKESLSKLRVCYNNSLRFLMHFGRYCSITEQFVRLGIPTFQELLRKTIVSLFHRLKQSENVLISSVFNSESCKSSLTYRKWSEIIFCDA